ncbi:MAG: hypothetical protein ABFD08_08120 [Syntrophomonas sp.]
MHAIKPGDTVTADDYNDIISPGFFRFIYDGTVDDGMQDTANTELNLSDYNYAFMFKTGAGITELGRIVLYVATDGDGQDLTVEIRASDYNPDGTNDGTLLKTVVIPKEFLPATKDAISIPIALLGLTAATTYWCVGKKAGDAINHTHIYSKGSQKDANHKTYRRSGSSGAWTDCNDSIGFVCYQGNGTGQPRHTLNAENGHTTIHYDGNGDPDYYYHYQPPADGPDGGIRKKLTLNYSGGLIQGGTPS